MKGINLKKASVLGIASLSLLLPSIAKAEKACTTYKNYYFFAEIYGGNIKDDGTYEGFLNTINSLVPGDKHSTNSSTYYPAIPENAERTEGRDKIKEGRICLTKTFEDGTKITDGPAIECDENSMTLEEYYGLRASAFSKGTTKTFNSEKGETTYLVYEEKKDNVVTNYFWHGKWFILNDDNDEIAEREHSVNFNSVGISDLAKGTFLPEKTYIVFDLFDTGRVTIKRDIYKKNIFKDDGTILVTPFKVSWSTGETPKNSLLAPALYYIEYNICKDKYNATINYYYYNTTNPVKDEDGNEVPAHKENELDPGYEKNVDSPKINGCTIVDTNGKKYNEDKTVKISIDASNPTDFTKNVYYDCPIEKDAEPNGTGDALIYIAWAIGLGALGYSVYYFMNLNKEKKEEI